MPIAYMTVVEGWAQTRWNVGGMLFAEALLAVAGMVIFVMAVALLGRRKRRTS
jgi:Na+/serine symporter